MKTLYIILQILFMIFTMLMLTLIIWNYIQDDRDICQVYGMCVGSEK